MDELKVGDKRWYVNHAYMIAILVTVEEVNDYFRKKNPEAYLFYDVDEPIGYDLDRDELLDSKEDAIAVLTELWHNTKSKGATLTEYREKRKRFIMSTWPADKRVWSVEYKNKQEKVGWFNANHILQKEV